MNREEITLLGFEIVAFSGDARSRLLEALTAAQKAIMPKLKNLLRRPMNVSLMHIIHKQSSYKKKHPVKILLLVLH